MQPKDRDCEMTKTELPTGNAGARICPSVSGAPSVKTIQAVVRRGIISLTIKVAVEPTAGVRTDYLGSPIAKDDSVSPSHYGMAKIPT